MIRSLVLAALMTLSASPVEGQRDALLEEVGVQLVAASTGNPEFPSPWGFQISSRWEFGNHWLLRLSFNRTSDESSKPGLVCSIYAPNVNCIQAMTHSQVALAGLRGSVLRTVDLGTSLRLGAGAGMSFNILRADNLGEDGRKADLLSPKTGIVGYLGLLSADLALDRRLPLHLTGGYTAHLLHFHTCSGFEPPQYDPFCDMALFHEAQLGFAWRF
jgi:hypothetical protein